jgi:acyl carrier protein
MSKSPEELRTTILSVLGEIAPEADAASIDAKESLRRQLDLDSMDFLNFVIGLHRRLGVEIPESDYARFASIDGAVEYLSAAAGA